MKEFFRSKRQELPAGEREFLEKRKESFLPAEKVENTVFWVNPAFIDLPFFLQEGKPSNLGLFFQGEGKDGNKKLYISPEMRSGRGALLGEIFIKDKDGNLYRDVDLKGVGGFFIVYDDKGFSVKRAPGGILDPLYPHHDAWQGILDISSALADRDSSEAFLKNKIRTYRVVGIIKLKELIDEAGKHISLSEAKRREIISLNTKPVIAIRAFGTKERVSYLKSSGERTELALEDARRLVAQELGRSLGSLSIHDYFLWFSETLGVQIARLRKEKLHHGSLHSQNITLDCRIVDLDSVRVVEGDKHEEGWYDQDFTDAMYALWDLFKFSNRVSDSDKEVYTNLFERAYNDEMKKKSFGGKLKDFFKKIRSGTS